MSVEENSMASSVLPPSKDITGLRSGCLTALKRLNEKSGASYLWFCRCDCGNETTVSQNELQNGDTIKKEKLMDSLKLVDNTSVTIPERCKKLRANNKSGYPDVYQEKTENGSRTSASRKSAIGWEDSIAEKMRSAHDSVERKCMIIFSMVLRGVQTPRSRKTCVTSNDVMKR